MGSELLCLQTLFPFQLRSWYPWLTCFYVSDAARLYFSFFEAEVRFEDQMEALTREVGDRGQASEVSYEPTPAPAPAPAPARPARVLEGVPSALAPAPAPARARAPTLAPATTPRQRALVPSAPDHASFSPSLQLAPQSVGSTGNFAEMSALYKDMRQDFRDEMLVTLQAAEVKMAAPPPQALISAEALAALQARLESLHSAQFLTDAQLFKLEDLCGDYLELHTTVEGGKTTSTSFSSLAGQNFAAVTNLQKVIGLAAKISSDAAFARQPLRKYA